jgi:hypothetical protein
VVGRALQQPQPPPARAAAGASAAERRSLRTLTLSSAGRCIGAAALPLPPGCLTPDADRVAARSQIAALEFAVDLRIYGSKHDLGAKLPERQNCQIQGPDPHKITDPPLERVYSGGTLSGVAGLPPAERAAGNAPRPGRGRERATPGAVSRMPICCRYTEHN